VIVDGLAGEYTNYLTTPEEYARGHYEAGFTVWGRYSSVLLQNAHVDLARALVSGAPAVTPHPYDPRNGVIANDTPFGRGAATGRAVSQPQAVARFEQASFSWQGGAKGLDRPLDRAFITLRVRSRGGRWRAVTDDRGLQLLWDVDADGTYHAAWEIQQDAPAGTYEFLVTANRYRLESAPFRVSRSVALDVAPVRAGARIGVTLAYPPTGEVHAIDGNGKTFTWHPPAPSGGRVVFCVGGRRVQVAHRRGARYTVAAPARAAVVVAARGARDRFGNTADAPLVVRAGSGARRC
jgi:hypothetical protein